jgi:acyl-CoA hydrolase
LAALTDRRRLRIHSGLVTENLLPLIRSGALSSSRGAITTGLVLGDRAFFDAMADDDRLIVAPISVTHDVGVIGTIERFISINAALEVDLFGQVNAEFAKGRQIAGAGGMADFVRAASASSGGCAIIALQAQGSDGASRIVAQLPGPCVTLARTDAPIIVTEFGVADLRGTDIEARAQRLIAIAAPDARNTLSRAWRELRSHL